MPTFALAIKQQAYGTLADRLGNGLQNRVDSSTLLGTSQEDRTFTSSVFFCFYTRNHEPQVRLSGNLVGISINLCKSIQKELFINDTP